MALGRFADVNLATTSVLSGGTWSVDLPLSNLLDDSRYIGAPARQLTPAVLANSKFEAVLARPRSISLIGVLFHTMSLDARYRLSIAAVGGTLAAPDLQTEWLPVYPRLFPSSQLAWEEANWWTGQPQAADLDLYPRHLWISIPTPMITSALRIEFDDHDNSAGFFDVGGLWIVSGWSPVMNFDRGRDLGIEARDLVDEGPSGRLFVEERAFRRVMSISWSRLTDAEALRLFDAGARARSSRNVLFAPDLDDGAALIREAFPATFETPPRPKFTYSGLNQVAAIIRETIA